MWKIFGRPSTCIFADELVDLICWSVVALKNVISANILTRYSASFYTHITVVLELSWSYPSLTWLILLMNGIYLEDQRLHVQQSNGPKSSLTRIGKLGLVIAIKLNALSWSEYKLSSFIKHGSWEADLAILVVFFFFSFCVGVEKIASEIWADCPVLLVVG